MSPLGRVKCVQPAHPRPSFEFAYDYRGNPRAALPGPGISWLYTPYRVPKRPPVEETRFSGAAPPGSAAAENPRLGAASLDQTASVRGPRARSNLVIVAFIAHQSLWAYPAFALRKDAGWADYEKTCEMNCRKNRHLRVTADDTVLIDASPPHSRYDSFAAAHSRGQSVRRGRIWPTRGRHISARHRAARLQLVAIAPPDDSPGWRNLLADHEPVSRAAARGTRHRMVSAHGIRRWRCSSGLRIKAENTPCQKQEIPGPAVCRAYMSQMGTDTLSYADLRIQALAEWERIPILAIASPFAARAELEQLFLHGFNNTKLGTGHWNEIGYRLAGEIIASSAVLGQSYFPHTENSAPSVASQR